MQQILVFARYLVVVVSAVSGLLLVPYASRVLLGAGLTLASFVVQVGLLTLNGGILREDGYVGQSRQPTALTLTHPTAAGTEAEVRRMQGGLSAVTSRYC
jgi:hypothetical protein